MQDKTITSLEAYEIALAALNKLVVEQGVNAKFPPDAIWEYADEEVPSTLRSGQINRLKRAGYLTDTGGRMPAVRKSRRGNEAIAYRPGPKFRPEEVTDELSRHISADVPQALNNMETAMATRGFIITAAQLANFYLALQTSPLIILTGTSGTGKSSLPRLFAEFIGAGDLFRLISVQPQWADNADLFGYTSSLATDVFVEGKFTTAIQDATRNTGKPAIILLDEMNLAAVEHYFSDFLSVVETRRKQNGQVITDALPLDLPRVELNHEYDALRDLRLPSNARVVGTANMDETTRTFSPKVLDRAFSIEFDDVDLTAFVYHDPSVVVDQQQFLSIASRLVDPSNPVSVSEVYNASRSLFDRIAGLLDEVKDILKPAGITFGYRTRDAICLYFWHWAKDGLSEIMPFSTAFDMCLMQKVLPKISGTGEALREALSQLVDWLEEEDGTDNNGLGSTEGQASVVAADNVTGTASPRPCPKSAEKVRSMLQQLNDEGATSYWST